MILVILKLFLSIRFHMKSFGLLVTVC